MGRLPLAALALSASLSGCAAARRPPAPPAALPPSAPEAAYEAELGRLQSVGLDGDFFDRLRRAYAGSARYDPYASRADEARKEMIAAVEAKDYPKVLERARAILAENFTDIHAHQAAGYACQKLERAPCSLYHRYLSRGLIGSVLASGDGISAKTAFRVVQVREEYAVLEELGFDGIGQALLEADGRHYDRLRGRDREKGAEAEVYFDIEPVFQWGLRSFGGGNAPPGQPSPP